MGNRPVLFVLGSVVIYSMALAASESDTILAYGLVGLVVGGMFGWMGAYYLSRWWVTQQGGEAPVRPRSTNGSTSRQQADRPQSSPYQDSGLGRKVKGKLLAMGVGERTAEEAARYAVQQTGIYEEAIRLAWEMARSSLVGR